MAAARSAAFLIFPCVDHRVYRIDAVCLRRKPTTILMKSEPIGPGSNGLRRTRWHWASSPFCPSLRDVEDGLCSKPCAFLWGLSKGGFCSVIRLFTLSSVLTDFLKGRQG